MDELILSGKTYISSKRAASVTGYAKDYVGQLAREGKVPATRVGRAWYVDESAIRSHAGLAAQEEQEGKQESVAESLPSEEKPLEIKKEEAHFLTTRQTAALYSLQHLRLHAPRQNSFTTWSPLTYSHEDEALLPHIKKRSEIHEIPVRIVSPAVTKNIVISDVAVSALHDGVRLREKSRMAKEETAPLKVVKKQPALPVPAIPVLGMLSLLLISAGAIGFSGAYAPAEWTYSLQSFGQTASTGDLDLVSGYFMDIFAQGIVLIGEFAISLLSSAGDFFRIGVEFLFSLF